MLEVPYGRQTSSLPLIEEMVMKVLEGRVLREISRVLDLRGYWRKMHNGGPSSFLLCAMQVCYLGQEIQQNGIGEACGMYELNEICMRRFGGCT